MASATKFLAASFLAALSLTSLGPAEASAQENVRWGVRAGVSMANMTGEDIQGAAYTTAFTGGAFLDFRLSDYFSVQPEAELMFEGARDDFTISFNEYSEISLGYLQVPLFLKATLPAGRFRPSLLAGPVVGVSLTDEFVAAEDANNNLFRDEVQQMQYGLGLGASVQYGRFLVDGRYKRGLANSLVFSDAKNQSFSVSVGYLF